ncbi:C40 family peptidase [Streptomyces sp. WAC06614]|uniref:C40 family peptidase n=1 Tax=Streptomyces sp. WAC06614 TaxID=2487416 RepID=UPI000F7787BC|nr:C40 family peptidase [Streptomyces sp. WAC06614]RSS81230.1 NlpC/P60 family protein [Streptomyces sp. WAC06614]
MSTHTLHTPAHTLQTPTHTRRAGPPRHRKPSRTVQGRNALNLGIATGVLGTLVAAAPASAAEQPESNTHTLELPVADLGLFDASESYDHLNDWAQRMELRGQEGQAAADAAVRARTGKAAAQQAERDKVASYEAAVKKAAADKAVAQQQAKDKAAKDKAAAGRQKAPKAPQWGGSGGGLSKVVDFARKKLGSPYVYGASSGNAFDCSSLVQAAYRAAGITIPRTSQEQSGAYPEVKGALQPGDILYWGAKGAAWHVAVYVGGGKFVGAQNSSTGVVLRDVANSNYSGAVRPG